MTDLTRNTDPTTGLAHLGHRPLVFGDRADAAAERSYRRGAAHAAQAIVEALADGHAIDEIIDWAHGPLMRWREGDPSMVDAMPSIATR